MRVASVDPTVDEAGWLEWRRAGIGASDLPALVGLSPWSTPLQVFMDKRGELPVDPGSEAMRLGHLLEPVAAQVFTEVTGIETTGHQVAVEAETAPWQRATIDTFTVDAEPVEVKTSGGLWSDLPDHVAVQVQYQLHVCDAERARVIQLVTGRGWRIHDVTRDEATIGLLVDVATEMWERVQAAEPPPATGPDNRVLSARYGIHVPGAVVDVQAGHIAAVVEARAAVKVAERLRDEAEATLKSQLGEAEAGLVDGDVAVTWRTTSRAGYTVAPGTSRRLHIAKGWAP